MHGKILLKQSCSIEKKFKNCAWSKVFLSHFYKVLLKQMCFGQYFNMCMETFYQKQSVSVQIYIKFYWNKCVLVNILICTCKNSIKTLCFGRKKQQELCLIKFCSNKCVSFNIFICTWKFLLKQSVSIEKKGQELCLIKSVSVTFL